MTNEFKQALDAINECDFVDQETDDGNLLYKLDENEVLKFFKSNKETILRALRIADALMGEPTEAMLNAGMDAVLAINNQASERKEALDAWEAMRDQMLADLDKGE